MNSALLERVKRTSTSSKRGLEEASDNDKKRSRLIGTGKENDATNVIQLSPKYIDDHPAPGLYPDTIQSFAAGIKGDVFELFTSIHKSFKVLLPIVATPDDQFARGKKEAEDQILKELEVNIVAPSDRIPAVQTKFTADEKAAKQNQIDNALRMRCSDPTALLKQDPSTLLAASAKCGAAARKESSQSVPRVKEGGKVQLSKLSSNPSIRAFDCADSCLLIIGNKRMIFVSRNSEDRSDTVANVVWWQSLNDIDGAIVSYLSDSSSQLEFSIRGGRALTVAFLTATSCTEVLQIIQSKRETTQDIIAVNSSSSSSCEDNTTAATATLAPPVRESDAAATVAPAGNSSIVLVDTKLSAALTPKKSVLSAAVSSVKRAVEVIARSVSPKRPPKETRELAAGLKKYQLMLKAGVPEAAVQAKMRAEGVDWVLVATESAPAAAVHAAAASSPKKAAPTLPAELGKYKSMLSAGVPLPAVLQRMSMDSIPADKTALFTSMHGGVIPSSGGGRAPVQEERAPAAAQVPAALMKFKLMLKAGVPEAAVQAKMRAEGVAEDQQQLLLLGAAPAATSAATPAAASAGQASTGQAKLLNLHWEPVDHKSGSIFSDLDACAGASISNTPTAFAQLASLFARKDATAAGSSKKEQGASKRAKTVDLKVIDIGRSTNICITLASLRSKGLNIDKIVAAFAALDTSILGVEELSKVGEIAPSEAETKAFCSLKTPAGAALHDSELCLQRLAAVEDLRGRLQSMRFLLSYAGSCDDMGKKVGVLREAAGRVLLSEGLKVVFKAVLDIGNVLNEGTWKGNAKAFKISSLQKLGQTKSSDGQSTLLDYLVELLRTRMQAGEECCAAALAIDKELGMCSAAKAVSIAELEKEAKVLRRELQEASALAGGSSSGAESATAATNAAHLLQAEQRISTVERAVEECRQKCAEMSLFVGEEPAQSQAVLQALADLVRGLVDSRVRAETRVKEGEKRRLAAERKAKKQLQI